MITEETTRRKVFIRARICTLLDLHGKLHCREIVRLFNSEWKGEVISVLADLYVEGRIYTHGVTNHFPRGVVRWCDYKPADEYNYKGVISMMTHYASNE